jgi:hypothetical protein
VQDNPNELRRRLTLDFASKVEVLGGTPRAIAKGVGSLVNETGDSHALRALERATHIYLDCLLLQHVNWASRDESVVIQVCVITNFQPKK